MVSDLPRYINETEVSQMTGIALSTLRNQRFQGAGMPYCKLGRSVRYSSEDVVNYMEQRKINTNKARFCR